MHVGGVSIFEPPEGGFDYDRLVQLVRRRIAVVPRYRQKVRSVPGHLANPVWVDDEDFDVTYHVRRRRCRARAPTRQLRDLVARILSRPLDRDRPLWEIYLVEGLAERAASPSSPRPTTRWSTGSARSTSGRCILDASPEPAARPPADTWRPAPEPADLELVAGAVSDLVRRPPAIARRGPGRRSATSGAPPAGVAGAVGGVLAWRRTVRARPRGQPAQRRDRRGPPVRHGRTPISTTTGRSARRHGGTVNDVVLAVGRRCACATGC